MKIILFGGTFNPIHEGHLKIAKAAMQKIEADKIFWIPSYISPNKKTQNMEIDDFVSSQDRINMIRAVVANLDNHFVDDFEIAKNNISYTIDTIYYFKKRFPYDDLYLLLGADQLETLPLWKNYKEILKHVNVICALRNTCKINEDTYSKKDVVFLDHSCMDNISSSWIRNNFAFYGIPEAAVQYINDRGIYPATRIKKFVSNARFEHVLRVGQYAYEIMSIYERENAIKGWVAGIYHDICKDFSEKLINKFVEVNNYDAKRSWRTYHGILAKDFLQKEYHFQDPMVLEAIANHVIPDTKKQLSTLDKVLFCCDKLEPNRTNEDVPDIDKFRVSLKVDLDGTFNQLLKGLTEYYSNKK